MRGEASRIADRESRDSLAPKLRDTHEDAWRIGNELFNNIRNLMTNTQFGDAIVNSLIVSVTSIYVISTVAF